MSTFSPLQIRQSISSIESDAGLELRAPEEITLDSFAPSPINIMKRAFSQVEIIGDTPQGSIIEAMCVDQFTTDRKQSHTNQPLTIKTCNKRLYIENMSYPDTDMMEWCCNDDIIKEKLILQYLTVDNHPIEDYIIKYYNFTEDSNNYYLITESVRNQMNLKQFSESAKLYIDSGKLKRKTYNKVLKYIFWQLSCALHWLHNDMRCCHLNLSMENIVLHNCGDSPFLRQSNGTVKINPKITPKICDFSNAEVFGSFDDFSCDKYNIFGENVASVQYLSPQLYSERTFDARSADMWALGMILYGCVIHKPLYTYIYDCERPLKGSGYWAVFNGKIREYLAAKDLWQNVNNAYLLSFMESLIVCDEEKRLNSCDLLTHKWFKGYYAQYSGCIKKKSDFVKKRLSMAHIQQKMRDFPYYVCE